MSLQSRLDSLITAIGTDIKSILNTTMLNTKGGAEKVTTATGTSGTVNLDLANASIFTLTPTNNVTGLTFSNVPASRGVTVTLRISQGATPYTIANPSGSKIMGVAVSQQANKVCTMTYFTIDGGSNWDVRGDREV